MVINNITSSFQSIQTGVPQGSVLGPLLYLLYINDLPEILTTAEMLMYADNTSLIIIGDNISDIDEKMNTELAKLADWFAANKLAINPNKTRYMVFQERSRRRVGSNTDELRIHCQHLVCVSHRPNLRFLC